MRGGFRLFHSRKKVEFTTKVSGDEQSLVQLIDYNMELGRMISTMAKNVFWVKTLLHAL